MKTAIELAASLSARYLDTKQMLPDELAHEAAAMILHQAEQIEQLEVERLRLAGEVSNRNIRALEGDKSAAAFNTLYDEFETLRAALTASYTSELDELAVRNYSLHKENESLLKANLDCFDNFNTLKADYDALKADAERYRWWVTQVEHKDFENLEKAFKSMEAREDVTKQMMDAAIDAMKGKS